MPGFSPTPKLYIGYGASPLIWISLIIFSICIILSIWFIFMLLLYREVRCQIKWDQWNMNTNVCCCILAASAGLLELFGIFQAKMFNCQDPRFGCAPRNRIFKSPPRKLLDMPYKQLHYASCLGKIFCAVLYSVCSRALLKNNDQVEG
ncbi:uncharacterized protein LOC118439292 [Folsomia candida]|nr:uncharacterized protein LOC118439292 [Folsomia candida]